MPEPEIAVAAPVRHCRMLLSERLDHLEKRAGLVVGCGHGDEVTYLRRAFGSSRTVGLDLTANFSPQARHEAGLLVSDAKHLPFAGESFDFAVAIHSLEHMGNPHFALAEVQRVLRPGAWFYLGVPNKTRLVGYVGSFDASLWQKFSWNLIDYGQRLRGRFKNELGAHAGFNARELESLLCAYFSNVQIATRAYLSFKYAGRLPQRVLDFLLAPRVINYAAPAHYALCQKR